MNAQSDKHISKFFAEHIGQDNCVAVTGPESENVKETISMMQETLERNGKPCCLNLITENDSKFLGKLAKEKRMKDSLVDLPRIEAALADLQNSTKDKAPKTKKEDPKSLAAAAALE